MGALWLRDAAAFVVGTIGHFTLNHLEVFIANSPTGIGAPVVFHCTGAGKKSSEFVTVFVKHFTCRHNPAYCKHLVLSYSVFRRRVSEAEWSENDRFFEELLKPIYDKLAPINK